MSDPFNGTATGLKRLDGCVKQARFAFGLAVVSVSGDTKYVRVSVNRAESGLSG